MAKNRKKQRESEQEAPTSLSDAQVRRIKRRAAKTMRQTLPFVVLLAGTLTACEVLPGADLEPNPSDDPSVHTDYGWCFETPTFEGVQARLFHPTSTNCGEMPFSPLVVLLPGKGFTLDRYDYLLRHLAQNGVVAVGLSLLASDATDHAGAVDDALAFLTGLRTSWSKRNFIDHQHVGLIGHSRGGGTVRHLAVSLEDLTHTWRVRALVNLAAVASDGLVVDEEMADAALFLHGTHDGDQIPETSFILYDRSSTEGAVFLNGLHRSMKLFENGRHDGFAASSISGGPVEMARVSQGYVMAFLAAHLEDDWIWYDPYIRGDGVPHGWSAGTVTGQYSDGVLRTVIDDAEDGTVHPNLLGGAVELTDAQASVLDLAGESGTFHDTRVLRVRGTSASGAVTWSIPPANRNASFFKYLSVRVGQTGGTPATDLALELRNGDIWSGPVTVADHGVIAQPMPMCTVFGGAGQINSCDTSDLGDRDHLSTVRIPLTVFGAIDDVQHVRLRFLGDAVLDWFYVDSLEFSEWITHP